MPHLDLVLQIWDRVRTSLWFVPGVMALGALVLAFGTPVLDRVGPDSWADGVILLFSGSPQAARGVLATIATAMIGITGVVFSMTIVSLQLASSQFGPRLLRSFLRDRGNQVVMGTFLGTFLYCIVVMPTIEARDGVDSVAQYAVTIAVLLSIVSLAMLVYYIDHVAQSIHADAVVQAVGRETLRAVDLVFPEEPGEPSDARAWKDRPEDEAPFLVRSTREGYLRIVNRHALVRIGSARDLEIDVVAMPGEFVLAGDVLAEVHPASRVDDEGARSMAGAFVTGVHRTTIQDASFGFEQLTEMALRALSPSIHDPTTALHCVNRIAAGLCRMVERGEAPGVCRDERGAVRVRLRPPTLESFLDRTVDPIARAAGSHLEVWTGLQSMLRSGLERAHRPDDRAVFRDAGRGLLARAEASIEHGVDLDRLRASMAWLEDPSEIDRDLRLETHDDGPSSGKG